MTLDLKFFKSPNQDFKGAPLWCWNTKLDRDELLRQVQVLHDMGFGGFFIHVRIGLETEYMGTEFMDLVEDCVKKAKELGMYANLYDEDRWPSGAAGGLVTENHEYRATHLLFTPYAYGDKRASMTMRGGANAKPSRAENGSLLAKYNVVLDDEGYLVSYMREKEGTKSTEPKPTETSLTWYAYMEQAPPSEWYNNQTYVDTLNPEATQRFIEVTHERYADKVGSEFGKSVQYMFTDEPQMPHKSVLSIADKLEDVFMPWTKLYVEKFKAHYNYDPVDYLPEIFFQFREPKISTFRYHYHDFVCELFIRGFPDYVGKWCADNNILLTGHVMSEPTLLSQTSAMGECMRSYRGFNVPGVDILQDKKEWSSVKQAQSVSNQYKRNGVLSEIYGVTNWTFDFNGHKNQGDWQAALGITLRCPHLSLVSLKGEAKRDFPASINYQSPWYKEYGLVETHFARLNAVMSQGRPLVKVAVIHPIESYWLWFGPQNLTSLEREQLDSDFNNVIQWLLRGLVDFDFVSESLLPDLYTETDKPSFSIGAMEYETVIVPPLKTIRNTTLQALKDFQKNGGKLIVLGDLATAVDAKISSSFADWVNKSESINRVPFIKSSLLKSVESDRQIKVILPNGKPSNNLLHRIRQNGDERYVFICNTDASQHGEPEIHEIYERLDNVKVSLKGDWVVTMLDTFTGEEKALSTFVANDWTLFTWTFASSSHLLLRLQPSKKVEEIEAIKTPLPALKFHTELADIVDYKLDQPNVLLLDQAKFRLADEKNWRGPEEILRIDNVLREQLNLPLKGQKIAQPWSDAKHNRGLETWGLEIEYEFESKVSVDKLEAAFEPCKGLELFLNDKKVSVDKNSGYFVDVDIKTYTLPAITTGQHKLRLKFPFGLRSNLERVYLLGEFGVHVLGRHAHITELPKTLTWGSWVSQGLPFYSGTVSYVTEVDLSEKGEYWVEVPHYRGPLVRVDAIENNSTSSVPVAFPPYKVPLNVSNAKQRLSFKLYGNNQNAFGAIHLANPETRFFSPGAWRTEGFNWAYEYCLDNIGILTAPKIYKKVD